MSHKPIVLTVSGKADIILLDTEIENSYVSNEFSM